MGGGYGWPAVPSSPEPVKAPKTRAEADELLRQICDLPEGFLAKLYVLLYEGKDLRIDSARQKARTYMGGLS